jgi:hypothetical protein
MYGKGFEDIAFERVKDLQREREYSRGQRGSTTLRLLGLVFEPLIELIEGLSPRAASASPPARHPAPRPRPAPRG